MGRLRGAPSLLSVTCCGEGGGGGANTHTHTDAAEAFSLQVKLKRRLAPPEGAATMTFISAGGNNTAAVRSRKRAADTFLAVSLTAVIFNPPSYLSR